MKKVLLITMAALSILFTQCKKTEIIPSTPAAEGGVSITLKVGGNSKVNVNPETGAVTFQRDDKIYVANGGKYVGTLTHNGTQFIGTIKNAKKTDEPLYFYFLGNKVSSGTLSEGTTSSLTVDLSDQKTELPVISCAPSNENYSPSTTNYTATLHNKCALVEFKLNQEVTSGYVAVKKMNNVVEVDLTGVGTFTPSKGNEMTKIFKKDNTHFYMIALEQNEIVSVDGDVICEDGREGNFGTLPAVVPGMYMSKDVTFASGPEYLCFTANAAGTISMMNPGWKKGIGEFGMGKVKDAPAPDLQYSKDNGATWTVWSDVTTEINVGEGAKVYIKAGETGNTSVYPYVFKTTGDLKVSGNIMYLLDKNPSPTATLPESCFAYLFLNYPEYNISNSITDASELQLPDVTSSYCYYGMFYGCTNLTAAPALPATTLAEGCYKYMFYGCTSLTEAPELSAETLADYCYVYMFCGCTSLIAAPALPATTLAGSCYYGMFYGCTSLTAAPALPATTLANYCYCYMFINCTSLNAAPALHAETLADYCYYWMFDGCTSLIAAPALPATTLADNCYNGMFHGCTSLTTAPALPAETLAESCYSNMFQDCTSLIAAPALPAETLAKSCYSSMFRGCTSLTAAPELPAETLADYCYGEMFSGCSNLTSVKMLATDASAEECLVLWLDGAGTGEKKVYINEDASDETKTIIEQNSTGWTVERLGSGPECLCFTANVAGKISMMEFNLPRGIGEFGMGEVKYATAPNLQYSTDNGATWTVWSDVTTDEISVGEGDKVYIKAGESGNTSIYPYVFQTTGDFMVSGNIMYLLDKNPSPELTMGQYCFAGLFMNFSYYNSYNSITDASELQLPETTSVNCYASMFLGCASLTAAPALPAETLAEYCYAGMFQGCASLTAAPALPATTLADFCYYVMFSGCISLTEAPELPAETLEASCYSMMFMGCISLTSVTMLATDVSATECLDFWLNNAGTSATNPTLLLV